MKLASIVTAIGLAAMGSAFPLGDLFARNPVHNHAVGPEPIPFKMDGHKEPTGTATPTRVLPVPTATGTPVAQVKRNEESNADLVYHFPRNFPDFGL